MDVVDARQLTSTGRTSHPGNKHHNTDRHQPPKRPRHLTTLSLEKRLHSPRATRETRSRFHRRTPRRGRSPSRLGRSWAGDELRPRRGYRASSRTELFRRWSCSFAPGTSFTAMLGRRPTSYLRRMIELASHDRPDVLCLQEVPLWALEHLGDWSGMQVATTTTLPSLLRAGSPAGFRVAIRGCGARRSRVRRTQFSSRPPTRLRTRRAAGEHAVAAPAANPLRPRRGTRRHRERSSLGRPR